MTCNKKQNPNYINAIIKIKVDSLKDHPKGHISSADELMSTQSIYLWLTSEIMNEYWIQNVQQQ